MLMTIEKKVRSKENIFDVFRLYNRLTVALLLVLYKSNLPNGLPSYRIHLIDL